MTTATRLAAVIVLACAASAAFAEDGDLFAGRGTTQPERTEPQTRGPAAVAATQPAAKAGPTTKPEVLTVKQLIDRIPDAVLDEKADQQTVAATVSELLVGQHLKVTGATGSPPDFRATGIIARRQAKNGKLQVSVNVVCDSAATPFSKIKSWPRTIACEAVVVRADLTAFGEMSVLNLLCKVHAVKGITTPRVH